MAKATLKSLHGAAGSLGVDQEEVDARCMCARPRRMAVEQLPLRLLQSWACLATLGYGDSDRHGHAARSKVPVEERQQEPSMTPCRFLGLAGVCASLRRARGVMLRRILRPRPSGG